MPKSLIRLAATQGPLTPPPTQMGVLGPRAGRIPAARGKFWAKMRILERIASGFRRNFFEGNTFKVKID